ncbi:MAG: ComF family protein [Bacteroidetes bacterium]|nr:MAG: ComF family protein [Bacteroidota bacterium]
MLKAFSDLFNLFFPRKCNHCGNNLDKTEVEVCKKCLFEIPKTYFLDDSENPVNKLFWGRVEVEFATSGFYFTKKSILQNLLHHIKYHNKKELACELGKYLGAELVTAGSFKDCDVIVPVPLHPAKMKKRGYNQSEWIAKGMSEKMAIPLNISLLNRHVNSETQTKKTREQRWENVRSAFNVKLPDNFSKKHILLIDDVITTGATIEACASQLIENTGLKVSIASLAYASSDS